MVKAQLPAPVLSTTPFVKVGVMAVGREPLMPTRILPSAMVIPPSALAPLNVATLFAGALVTVRPLKVGLAPVEMFCALAMVL